MRIFDYNTADRLNVQLHLSTLKPWSTQLKRLSQLLQNIKVQFYLFQSAIDKINKKSCLPGRGNDQ